MDDSKTPAGTNHAAAHALATGAGVKVAVIEFSNVNPAYVLLDEEGRFVKNLNFRNVSNPPTSDPTDSPYYGKSPLHTAKVAKIMADSDPTYTGVAPAAMLYSGGAGSYETWLYAVDWLYRGHGVGVFNFSMGSSGAGDNGQSNEAKAFDYHMFAFDTLIVAAAGNTSSDIDKPWDFYNGITVGAVDASFKARASYSSYLVYGETGSGSSVDWRPKPEVVAPGDVTVSSPNTGGTGTSWAAPHVVGIAALLQQGTPTTPGLPLGAAGQSNHLAIKAIIMNSARKRHITGPQNGYPYASDYSGTGAQASDGDYLNGATFRSGTSTSAPKTGQWTPSQWSYSSGVFSTIAPLDDELGAGVADAYRSLIQLDGGNQGPGQVRPIGWNTDRLPSGSTKDYALNARIEANSFLTATLVWDRPVTWTDTLVKPGLDIYDTFTAQTVPNLALKVFYRGSLYAVSDGNANVEHLHVPLLTSADPGDYVISVAAGSGVNNTPYALAWWAVPEPATSSVLLAAVGLFGRLRRRRGA